MALLVGAAGVTAAGAQTASPSPSVSPPARAAVAPVDVRMAIGFPPGDVAPGSRVFLTVKAAIVGGAPEKLTAVVKVPAGMQYVSTMLDPNETKECASSADKRTVTCTSQYTPARELSYRLQMIVDESLKPGTDLPLTATASTGDEPDATPADNTASTVLQVRTGADFGVKWYTPKTSVKPGESVTTKLVVTNHSDRTSRGPGGVLMRTLTNGVWPYEYPGDPCWAESNQWVCEWEAFAPGESRTYVMKWRVPKEFTAGMTLRASAGTLFSDRDDPVPGNDKDVLVLKVVKGSGGTGPTPTPTPTSTATPTPTPTVSDSASASAPAPVPSVNGGGGNLAATGAGVGTEVLGTAVGLIVLGGGMFVLVRARRRLR
ncbi:hypothetical protein ABZX85_19000 [Streptomyces sp. NPDC004539]|uniref:hypothetical protein n=1 Tax=Streptomyces sp. NPDC004539 TaxID=3154280 RepID=UPI0033BE360C